MESSRPVTSILPAADLDGLSPDTINELLKLLNQRNNSYTIAFYPISSIVYVVILYFNAKLVEYLFYRFSPVYRSMTHANNRTSVMYILNIVHTTVVLILQLIVSPTLAQKHTVERADLIKVAGVVVSFLYLFEMIYRDSMRIQLLVHHVATLFAICLVAGMLDSSKHPSLIVTALVWLFQASIEQLTFVALLMYRLQYPVRRVSCLLKFSAIQNLIPKFGFAIYLLVWWGQHQVRNNETSLDLAYSVVFVICLCVLIPVQAYGSWVLWKIADGMTKRSRTQEDEAEKQPAPTDNTGATQTPSNRTIKNTTQASIVPSNRPPDSEEHRAVSPDNGDGLRWDASTRSSFTLLGSSGISGINENESQA